MRTIVLLLLTHLKRASRKCGAFLLLVVFGSLAACEDLMDVEIPSLLPEEEVLQPSNAEILANGARADFECAFANYVLASGQMADELERRGGGSVNQGYDRRDYISSDPWYANFPCERGSGSQEAASIYTPLQTARASNQKLKNIVREEWMDEARDPNALIAQTAAFAGYSILLLGEGMCSAAIDLGPELSKSELWSLAEQEFTDAIEAATAADRSDMRGLALVGRARTRVNLRDFGGARADAAEVPQGFHLEARYSEANFRVYNFVHESNNRQREVGVGPLYHNMEFEGVPDPRVRVRDDGPVVPGHPDHVWVQENYQSLSSPIPIATWEEAQLIIAEAELEAGNSSETVNRINLLHGNVGLPLFESSDAEEIREHLIEERRRQLFLQSHALQDIVHFDLPLLPPPGAQFRDTNFVYGDNTCLPLPDIERENNPNIS